MLALHALAGPFEAVGNILGRKLTGPSLNIDDVFGWSNGPIQSGQNHYWKEATGPIRENQCHLFMLRRAHSKQSETIFTGPFRECGYWLCMLWRAHSKQSETFSEEK